MIGFTYRQINRNFKKDFDEDYPVALVKVSQGQKTPGFNAAEMIYTLKNGVRLSWLRQITSLNSRGLNATKIILLEASNISFPIFDALKSRLRNTAASIPKLNKLGKQVFEYDEKTGKWFHKQKQNGIPWPRI